MIKTTKISIICFIDEKVIKTEVNDLPQFTESIFSCKLRPRTQALLILDLVFLSIETPAFLRTSLKPNGL